MAMNPMAPSRVPSPTAFKLLAELQEFFAHPAKDRKAAMDAYAEASEARQTALLTIESDVAAATANRIGAANIKSEAEEAAQAIETEAHAKAKRIVDTANEQAGSINKTTAENVAEARTSIEAAAEDAQDWADALQTREVACKEREAHAFQERENAVTQRESKVTKREREAEEMLALGVSTKEGYEALLRQINSLMPQAAE